MFHFIKVKPKNCQESWYLNLFHVKCREIIMNNICLEKKGNVLSLRVIIAKMDEQDLIVL